jgi:hypothetical protein
MQSDKSKSSSCDEIIFRLVPKDNLITDGEFRLEDLNLAQRVQAAWDNEEANRIAVLRYPILRHNPDGSSGSSVVPGTTPQKDFQEIINAYYHPTIGSAEANYPIVLYRNDTQNNRYLSICAASHLEKRGTTLPNLTLTKEDCLALEKVEKFIQECKAHNLHPFIRHSMISDAAKETINLCCQRQAHDQRSDWPNWSNASFVGLYKVFCSGILNDKVGSGQTTTSRPQLPAQLESYQQAGHSLSTRSGVEQAGPQHEPVGKADV